MASFQIHQDAEKENPPAPGGVVLKERKVLGGITIGGGGAGIGFGGSGAFKDKQQQHQQQADMRVGFGALKTKTNGAGGEAGGKMAFREVGNVAAEPKDEQNVAINNKKATASAPMIVDQYKGFAVYEDQSVATAATVILQEQQQQQQENAENAITTADKENIYASLKCNERESLYRHVGGNDFTPMSLGDMLSPMSVDRSLIVHAAAQLNDDSSSKVVAMQQLQQNQQHEAEGGAVVGPLKTTATTTTETIAALGRSDRQRFYEVVEYQESILEYFREREKHHRPKPHYMRRQSDINYSMRTILVDWLVEVSEEYNLDTETLYLSVSYIDRFLSHMSVVRSKLQLVGTAAMYIASKYEEIYPPDVGEFVFITDDTYSKSQVLRMEQIILKILSFDLGTPSGYVFVTTYAVLTDMPDQLKYLSLYICELSLLEADPYLRFMPSLISSASVALARYTLDMPIWTAQLAEITKYRLEDMREVLLHLCKSHNAAIVLSQQAMQDKYKAEKYKEVANIQPRELTVERFAELLNEYNNKADNSATDENLEALDKDQQ